MVEDTTYSTDPKTRDSGQFNRDPGNDLLDLAFRTTNQDRAIKYCRQALSLSPENKVAYFHMALIYSAKMRWEDALECYSRALEIDASDPSLWFNAGLICLNAGWINKAESYFLHTKELDPVCEAAHFYLATIYFRRGDLPIARDLAILALDLRPTECVIKRQDFVELISQIEMQIQR